MNKFLKNLSINDLNGGINIIDIGAIGSLDPTWNNLLSKLNIIGFEPNLEACSELKDLYRNFNKAEFFPFAIGGIDGVSKINITEHEECYSLLKPNKEWLKRFNYGDYFEVLKESEVNTKTLESMSNIQHIDFDAIKIDAQGMELPILNSANNILSSAFYVELETGLQENYHKETTLDQVMPFMRDRDFLLFDLKTQPPEPRKNLFAQHEESFGQPMASEGIWLKDYVALDSKGNFDKEKFSRGKALRVLLLAAKDQHYDFGYELAQLFYSKGIIYQNDFDNLSELKSWFLHDEVNYNKLSLLAANFVRLFPTQIRYEISQIVHDISKKPSILGFLTK
jgi:FkbM family methyltransferase